MPFRPNEVYHFNKADFKNVDEGDFERYLENREVIWETAQNIVKEGIELKGNEEDQVILKILINIIQNQNSITAKTKNREDLIPSSDANPEKLTAKFEAALKIHQYLSIDLSMRSLQHYRNNMKCYKLRNDDLTPKQITKYPLNKTEYFIWRSTILRMPAEPVKSMKEYFITTLDKQEKNQADALYAILNHRERRCFHAAIFRYFARGLFKVV